MFRSFKAKIIMLILSVLVVFGTASFIQFRMALNAQRANILNNFGSFAEGLSQSVAAQFFERYGDVQAFARNQAFQMNNPALLVNAFNEYAALYGIYDIILYVDMNGRYVASNTVSATGQKLDVTALKVRNFANEPWFKAVSTGRFTEDAKKGFVGTFVEDAMFDPIVADVYRTDGYGNSFSSVVKDENGRPLGVITNRANFKWVEGEFANLYKRFKAEGLTSAELTLLSKNGTVLIDYDPSVNAGDLTAKRDKNVLLKLNLVEKNVSSAREAASGKSGSEISFHARKQIEQISGYGPINSDKFLEAVGWMVLTRIDKTQMYHLIDRADAQYQMIGAILFAIFIFFGWYISSKISDRLWGITKSIADAGVQVNNGSGQLSSASQQVSSGSTEAAASLEETVSSIEELSSMVKLNADNAKQAAALSQTSTRSAEEGELEIRRLITSMKDISQSSKKIEEIINVIDDIAFQTNLLALNAAVEAARAGEQGKGFAVVAEAVRNLAQRSASAAKDITSLIKDSVSQIENGTKIADASGSVLKNIVGSVKKVSDLNNEIASGSAEQANGIGQISKAMNELDQSTQQNASASEEVAAAATEMSSQSDLLSKLVGELTAIITGGDGSSLMRGNEDRGHGSTSMNGKAVAPRLKAVMGAKATHSGPTKGAENVIPFGDQEVTNKVGTTDGF